MGMWLAARFDTPVLVLADSAHVARCAIIPHSVIPAKAGTHEAIYLCHVGSVHSIYAVMVTGSDVGILR